MVFVCLGWAGHWPHLQSTPVMTPDWHWVRKLNISITEPNKWSLTEALSVGHWCNLYYLARSEANSVPDMAFTLAQAPVSSDGWPGPVTYCSDSASTFRNREKARDSQSWKEHVIYIWMVVWVCDEYGPAWHCVCNESDWPVCSVCSHNHIWDAPVINMWEDENYNPAKICDTDTQQILNLDTRIFSVVFFPTSWFSLSQCQYQLVNLHYSLASCMRSEVWWIHPGQTWHHVTSWHHTWHCHEPSWRMWQTESGHSQVMTLSLGWTRRARDEYEWAGQ